MEDLRTRISDIWGPRTPYVGRWPSRVDTNVTEQPERWIQSACVLCSNGCALDIGVKDGVIVGVRGRDGDPVNHGRLGPKGLYGWEANASPDRLRRPMIRRGSVLKPASWEEAMDLVVSRTNEIRERYTSQAISFYTSGQLFIEDYYTLSMVARGGIGTPHLDGNTRLCTATASEALKESFGSDGQPGSFTDFDTADTIFHVGQNVAETKTVLWSRVLDRRRGPQPPKLIVADPRRTPTAREADLHLMLRSGTNLALMNGLLHLIIESGKLDHAFLRDHTVGFEGLKEAVRPWTPERTAEATGVPAALLRQAADILGAAQRLVSTVLQGVYQSRQATAAAVQVNNLHLIRGMIGKPGCAVFQMNGQPTAQNTRETGCDGGMPAFRNWDNPDHMRDLARAWNLDPEQIAHWSPPTPVMQMLRYAELGSLKMMWICGTNPAVSLPELTRIRSILSKRDFFVVVNDAFPTETTEFADVVFPAALWGEKTGTFTNSDRTVHLSMKAVEPPGEAKSDMGIFVEFARRMDFRDKDGEPLIKWTDPKGAFEAWKECSRGWPCDYSGLSYEKLEKGGIHWPCTEAAPDGTERLYTDGVFKTAAARCQTYGHDLATGAAITAEKYKATDPAGRAIIRPADVEPPSELPDAEYPLLLTTGRRVYHFHTRTKTGRSKELSGAEPDVDVEISADDAARLGILEGTLLAVETRRGRVEGPARIGELAPGHLFVPFHYGWWDLPGRSRAANELTLTEWDPVSKQPHYKQAAARVTKIDAYTKPRDPASYRKGVARKRVSLSAAKETLGLSRPHLADYLGILEGGVTQMAEAAAAMRERHPAEPEVVHGCRLLETWTRRELGDLESIAERYGRKKKAVGEKLRRVLLGAKKPGGFGLVRDLHDLWVLAHGVKISLVALEQAARTLRDKPMESSLSRIAFENERQIGWILTRLKATAPQALVVPS
jgi:anaerobic selenocysteine-containing dehydrogenase